MVSDGSARKSGGSAVKWAAVGGLAGVAGVAWAIFAYVLPPSDPDSEKREDNFVVTGSVFGPITVDIAVGSSVKIHDKLTVNVNTVTDDSADISLSSGSKTCNVHISDGGAEAKIKNGLMQFLISFSGGVPGREVSLTVTAGAGAGKAAEVGVCT